MPGDEGDCSSGQMLVVHCKQRGAEGREYTAAIQKGDVDLGQERHDS